jgi:DNA gyrase/topoisomerase IV subunit A
MGWNAWDLGITRTKAKEANVRFKKEKKEQKKTFDFQKKMEFSKSEEEKNIKKQKQEKKEGKKVTCSYNTDDGRCGMEVVKGDTRCTVHQVVKQRTDGKETQCKKIKKNKQRCGVMTGNKSGFCYYHD